MEIIRHLDKIDKNGVWIAGGKGASLGEMLKTGLPVPEGFVILSHAFEEFIKKTDLNVEIDAILDTVSIEEVHTVEGASEKIQSLILSENIPEEISRKIESNFNELGARFVAVRSSATAEDSSSAAWAGQLDTFLNTTRENLLENVRRCWASLFTPRAIFYRIEKNLSSEKVSVAVIVQKMINSEKSGIAFSVHPITENPNQLIIEAGFGLGEAIVSGQITPDNYVVDKEDLHIIDTNIHEQARGLFRKQGGGNEWKALGEKGKRQVLENKEIIELSRLIVKIEKHYGFPCDIEWAKEKGEFYIVQSRPITTLKGKLPEENMLNIGNYSDYQRLFQWKGGGLPYLITEIYMDYYKTLRCLCLLADKVWTNFLPKEAVEQTLKDGLELVKNNEKFEKYKKDFNEYQKACSSFFDSMKKKQDINKNEMKKAISLMARLFYYYSKTEFFYLDKAFEYAQNHKEAKINLDQFDKIKNGGREHLNRVFLGPNSSIEDLFRILEKKFDAKAKDLHWYTIPEIIGLFDNKKPNAERLNERRRAFIMQAENEKIVSIQGEYAEKIVRDFLHNFEEKETYKGIVANGGKVTGKVKVIHCGFEDFEKMKDLVNEMEKGDILVAETTSPELMIACKKASAILTNQGGLMSHAAIVSREFDIPCVLGLGEITHVLKDGDIVEVDGDKGIVKILERKSKLGNVKGYGRLSRHPGVGVLLNTIWMKTYKDYNPIALVHNNEMICYMPNEKFEKAGQVGLELYTNEDNFKKYFEEGRKFREQMEEYIDKALKGEITKEIAVKIFDYFSEFIFWYMKTEFIFTDKSYNVWSETKDKVLGKNIEKFGDLKIEGRNFMNKCFMGKDSFLSRTLKKIGGKFKVDIDNLFMYTREEIIRIFDGKIVPERILSERKKANIVVQKNGKLDIYSGKEAEEMIKDFKGVENEKEIIGTIANKGIARGIVKILLVDWSDASNIAEQVAKMEKGDILVAETTSPEIIVACKKAAAIITDQGGLMSHAAIVSRELGIPCLVGTHNATKILKDGNLIEVDANKGKVKILKRD